MKNLDALLTGGVRDRRVLVRADLNTPLTWTNENAPGEITDDGRIHASLPTIRELCDAGAMVTICAHLGRPGGEHNRRYSLEPIAIRLSELLRVRVRFLSLDMARTRSTHRRGDGDVVLLENVRFDPRETSKDAAQRQSFAAELAECAEFYVDDAFGVVHRAHASVYEVAQLRPSYAGRLVEREVEVLSQLVSGPRRPYVVALGGSKVSDKLAVTKALLPTVDTLLIGGGMCFTFLAAQGHEVGDSLVEPTMIDACRDLLANAASSGATIVLPSDVVVASEISDTVHTEVVSASAIPAKGKGLDIGPASRAAFAEVLGAAQTVFWNGPMGVFEFAPFAEGTRSVAKAIAHCAGLTVVGGGDSAAAVRVLGIGENSFSHISTGGGASLEYLEGAKLPGLVVLEENPQQ